MVQGRMQAERCRVSGGTARSATVGKGPWERGLGTGGCGDAGGRGECLLDAAKDANTALWLGGACGTNSTSSVDETDMQGESSCVGATSGIAAMLCASVAGYSRVASNAESSCVASAGCVDRSMIGDASDCGPAGPESCAWRWVACSAHRRLMLA